MFFVLFITMIYVTRLAVLAQMQSFYMDQYRMTKLLIQSACQKEAGHWLKDTYSKGGSKKKAKSKERTNNIYMWLKYSWTCKRQVDEK
jgi:hypothetical protein